MVPPRQAFLALLVTLCLVSVLVGQSTALSGSWQALLTNSQGTVELNLSLELQTEGIVSGTYTLQDGVSGAISGQFDGTLLLLVFVGPANDCPATFTLRVGLTGKAGAGTYTASGCDGAKENGVVSISQKSDTNSILADCLYQHEEEGYWSWLCNEQGTALSDQVSTFIRRENRFGYQGITSLWSGPKAEWKEREGAKVIAQTDKQLKATCETYYHVAYLKPDGNVQWNWLLKNMLNWYKKDSRKKFPKLCHVAEAAAADYVIVYTESESSVPYSFSIPVQKTTYHRGTIMGGGNTAIYSGTSTATETKTVSGSWSRWHISAAVYPVKANTTMIFSTKHTGRWRWSKPDKDSLIDALEFVEKQ